MVIILVFFVKPCLPCAKLQPIWKSSKYSLRTKMHIYNSNVKSVLLYGSECWRIIESSIKKVEVFHNNCGSLFIVIGSGVALMVIILVFFVKPCLPCILIHTVSLLL
jgi:uncharacterized protein YqhQ